MQVVARSRTPVGACRGPREKREARKRIPSPCRARSQRGRAARGNTGSSVKIQENARCGGECPIAARVLWAVAPARDASTHLRAHPYAQRASRASASAPTIAERAAAHRWRRDRALRDKKDEQPMTNTDWNPSNTHVVILGLGLDDWAEPDNPSWKRHRTLAQMFERAGVPEGQVHLWEDATGTAASIKRRLPRILDHWMNCRQ